MGLHVSSNFDAGNIVVNEVSGNDAKLSLRQDPFTHGTDNSSHSQWFYFKASNLDTSSDASFSIGGLKECSYPSAWPGYTVAASYDRNEWFRVQETTYDEQNGILQWTVAPLQSQLFFAYFAPYSYERHMDLIARCEGSDLARCEVLGSTLDGRDMDLVIAGNGKRKIWVNARQHPGESMAEFFAEGFLERLLDPMDPQATKLRALATVHCVPNMCPDGAIRGHLRTNACGANLNREWANTGSYEAPTMERSPEVFLVLRKMDAVGCDCYVDVHGDEEIAANFFAGSEGIPSWSPRLARLLADFSAAFLHASADFQDDKGYPVDDAGGANLAICTNQVAERFDCLAVTLEQPFKDSSFNTPIPSVGWSPARSKKLGAAMVDALLDVAPKLRPADTAE